MQYTIEECDRYLDELTDKLGSDYFPLPIKFGRFITWTYDFIHENLSYFELNQETSDDLKNLLIRQKNILTGIISRRGVYVMAEPINYFRLVSIVPYARIHNKNVVLAKKVKIVKEGQRLALERDPFNKPEPSYPTVCRLQNIFEINTGDLVNNYSEAEITYVKKPKFGDMDNINDRIVDLPDSVIERILLKTAESLRFTTSDESSADIYNFDQTFGKKNK